MSPQDFLAHFHEIANAPGGVARLREVTYSLAVRGHLISNDPAESALPLGTTILSAGSRPIADNEKHLDDVPPNWTWARFEWLGEIFGGQTPSMSKSEFWGGDIPWVSPKDMRAKVIRGAEMHITSKALDQTSLKVVPPGSIVFVTRSGILRRTLPVAVTEVECVVNQDLKVLMPHEPKLTPYLIVLLRGFEALILSELVKTGTTVQSVIFDAFRNKAFPLPPLAEQKRIVAKVEELMALCDALEAQQQERARLLPRLSRATHTRLTDSPTQPHLDSLFIDLGSASPDDMRRTIIKLAFQGNLTQQLPNDDPADAIVQRLSAARSRHETKGGLRSRIPLDMPLQSSSAPFGIPNSWKWVRLHEVAWIKHGYAFDSESFSDTPTEYVVATPGNFFERGGFRDRGARTKYYAGKVDPEFIFQAGDLIIPMTEQAPGLLGSPAFIPEDGKTYIHNQRLGKLCFYSEEVSPWFAYWFFNTPFFRSELSRTCTGMKVRHTSPSRVLAVPFPICSLVEQRRIVAKVDDLMALVDTLETQQQEKSRLAETFAQTCVASLTTIASD